jgi:hypothetical protein
VRRARLDGEGGGGASTEDSKRQSAEHAAGSRCEWCSISHIDKLCRRSTNPAAAAPSTSLRADALSVSLGRGGGTVSAVAREAEMFSLKNGRASGSGARAGGREAGAKPT